MDNIILNIFLSSIGFTLSMIAFLFLWLGEGKRYGVGYLFLIFTVVKFTEIGNFIFNDNSMQEIFGVGYSGIAQKIGVISMVLYPIANTNIVLSILSISKKKLKDRNKKILLLAGICALFLVSYENRGIKLFFLALNLIIIPTLLIQLYKNKIILKERGIYKTVFVFELFQLIAFLSLTILHFINNEPFDPTVNVVTGDFIRGNDIGIINLLIIINLILWLRNPKLYDGKLFIENNVLSKSFISNWNFMDKEKSTEFILKYYHNSLQFDNITNKIIRLEEKFICNEAQFDNVEEMSNLLGIKTTHLKNIYDTFNENSFSKSLIKLKMMKAKKLIDNNYLENNSMDHLISLVNYKSKSAFINNFKSIVGTTPGKYSKIIDKNLLKEIKQLR